MGVGVQRHALAALPPGKTRYSLYGRPDGPQGRYGHVRKTSAPPGFDPRTVQPVASRYTDCAILAHHCERHDFLNRISVYVWHKFSDVCGIAIWSLA